MEQRLRIGIVGLGYRGTSTLQRYMMLEEVDIVAIADLSEDALARATEMMREAPRKHEAKVYGGTDGWQRLCRQADIDLVVVCTDWASHAEIALCAMESGRHVAIEVPAATTVADCNRLIQASRRTGRHCTMLENCCYDTFHLGTMEMVRKGLFGELTHLEGAYIHDLRESFANGGNWMARFTLNHAGNPYPTHGIGPVCQLLEAGKADDRLVSLVSMTAPNNVSNTLLRTASGRTVLLQFDERTPRPYSRLQTVCGTKGFAQKYPLMTVQTDECGLLTGSEAEAFVHSFWNEETRQYIQKGTQLGIKNMMNYLMDCRLVSLLLRGERPDITVEDAALWSGIAELTARSASQGGQPVEIPDFRIPQVR